MYELRNALRRLMAHPVSSLICISVLGLGLGSVLFLLTLVNGLILAPLPFPYAERMVGIGYERENNVGIGIMSSADYQLLRQELHGVEALGAHAVASVTVGQGQGSKRYAATLLTEQMSAMLGAAPLLGRGFQTADDRPGAALTVVLSERTWRNDFNADRAILGRSVRVNGEAATVVGVYPDGFSFPTESELWLPRRMQAGETDDVEVVGLLPASVSLEQARAELESSAAMLGARLAGQRANQKLILKPYQYRFVNETTRSYVWLMFAASAMVLLLACANCANLQLSQILARRRELAIYSALGASRALLLREQLAECLLLSVAATALSMGVAQLGSAWIVALFGANDKAPPYFIHLGLDGRMLAFALLAALITTALAGLLPALWASRANAQDALREGDKGSSGGVVAHTAKALIIVEIALTVVLLVGAGTFIRGLDRMLAMDIGTATRPDQVLTANLTLFPDQYATPAEQTAYFERIVGRLRADPAVVSATAANTVPGARLGSHEYIGAVGAAQPAGGYAKAQLGIVDDYFAATYGVKLVSGRLLDARDQADSARVAVISGKMAQLLWPGKEALGQRLYLNPQRDTPTELTVIGVVEALQLDGPLEPALSSMLVSLRQFPIDSVTLAVHTRADPLDYARTLSQLVAAENPDTAPYHVRTQEQSIGTQRLTIVVLTKIFSTVGMLALLLAATGLYGVLAFSVTQRTKEIGIRRAIGASHLRIIDSVGTRVLAQVLLGLGVGIGLALPWSSVLAKPEMHTQGYDVNVFVTVGAVIIGVAFIACIGPLRRVLAIDPMVALRHD
jgi:putative ABC transport system permease protein